MRHISYARNLATATLVAGALLAVVFSVRTAFAQEPEDPVPEPGYIAQPGDERYVIVPTPSPEDGVEGDSQHECEDDPLRAECDPAPPTGLRITRVGTKLSVHFTESRWRGSNAHWYRVELHRSSSRTGTYTLNKSDWDNVPPEEDLSNVSRGYYYKARAKRCRTYDVNQCGDWTSFTSPTYVPRLPSRATDLDLKWGKPTSPEQVRLTADFGGSLSSYDIVEIQHRRFDPTRGQVSTKYNTGHQTSSKRSYSRNVDRGYEYRVRVRRCTDSGHTDCGSWTSWTSWLKIPKLATGMSISRVKANLTASYSREGTTYDLIDMNRRLIGASGDGVSEADGNITGTRYARNGVDRGYEYRFRVRRCVDSARTACGPSEDWSAWSPWTVVPKLATGLSISRVKVNLTATYSREGTSYDRIDMRRRLIGGSGDGSSVPNVLRVTDTSYGRNNVTRGYEYRFRIRRCVDSARSDCGGSEDWSDWSPWKVVPKLATSLSISRVKVNLTATYSREGTSYDRIDMRRRLIGGSGDGSSVPNVLRVTDTSYGRNDVTRGYEYRFRIRRCVDSARSDCGGSEDWSSWSAWKVVPKLATSLKPSRNGLTLTATYNREGTTYDMIDVDRRRIGTTGNGSAEADGNVRGSSYIRNGVETGYEYRFRIRRCLDSARTDCGGSADWSEWSRWIRFLSLPAGLSLSRSKVRLTATYSTVGTSHDVIDMDYRRIGSTGNGAAEVDGSFSGSGYTRVIDRGNEYRFRVRRCEDTARTRCGGSDDWSAWSAWKVVPKLATGLSISRVTDDMTATYSREGTTYDVIDLDRRLIGTSGNGGAEAGGNVTGTRYSRNNVDRGYEYRFRIRRCVDSARLNDCGGSDDWSDWSPWKVVPKLATGLSLSRSVTTLTATYSGEGRTYDVIDMVGRTIGTTGNGSAEADDDISGSGFTRNVDRGDEYRFRVRRCVDSTRRDCGGDDWSGWSDWEPVPNLPSAPGTPTITVSDDDLTVAYTASDASHDELQFQNSDSETSGFTNYTGGTLSGKVLSDVDRNKWYRVRVRRCTDEEFTDCIGWSQYSAAKEVPGIGVSIASRADGKSAVASYSLLTGFTYTLQLQSLAGTQGATWTTVGSSATVDSTASSRTYTGLTTSSLNYRARLSACTTARPRTCTDYDSASITLSKAPAPMITGITVANQDDLTVVYTVTAWTNGTGDHYDFEIERGETASGSFSDYDDATTPSTTPHVFNNVHTGYYYKAQGRRCSDSAATICGDWYEYSSAVNVPALAVPAPTSITVSNPSQATVQAAFTPGPSSGRSVQYHIFEVGKSDTEAGTFAYSGATDVGTASPVTFGELETGKWYKARGKGCLDSARKRCGGWAYSSGAVEVEGISVSIASRADGKSAIASFNLLTGFNYTLQLESRATTSTGSWTAVGSSASLADSATKRTYTGLAGGTSLDYRVRLSACPESTSNNCVNHDSTSITLSKAPAPKNPSLTLANQNDLTVVYTVAAWVNGTGDHYDFEIERAETATGSFSDYDDATTPSTTPHVFNNVHTGFYYKARGRRCSDKAATICGDWSVLSSAVNVPALAAPPKPLNLLVSIVSHTEVKAEFTHSTWPGRDVEPRYVFQVGKSATENGEYVYSDEEDVDAATSVSFDGLETGKWYKVRGKRCYSPARKRCGSWAASASAVETVAPNPKLKFVNAVTKLTIHAGLPKTIIASASGLDRTKLYKMEFQTSRNAVLKFAKCDAEKELEDLLDSVDQSLAPGSGAGGPVSKTLYACVSGIDPSTDKKIDPAPSDTLTVNLVEGVGAPVRWGNTVDTIELTATVDVVPSPTDLRVDGDNSGNESRFALIDVAWRSVTGATSYELRHGTECPALGGGGQDGHLCPEANAFKSWVDETTGITASPYTVTLGFRVFELDSLHRVELRTVRNGVRSAWSKPVYVYPDTGTNTNVRAATMRFYGHHVDREYTYRLCESSFPTYDANKLTQDNAHKELVTNIVAGFDAWGEAINWTSATHGESREFIKATRDTTSDGGNGPGSCHKYTPDVTVTTYINGEAYPLTVKGTRNHPYAEVRFVHPHVLLERCTFFGLGGAPGGCAPHDNLLSSGTTFVTRIDNRSIPDDVDVLLSEDLDWDKVLTGYGSDGVALECTRLLQYAIHESGHALGVSGFHSNTHLSIMYYKVPEYLCAPSLYDAVDMLTNYQTVRPR